MSKEEFLAAFRFEMMGFLGEAWAARKEAPDKIGMVMDGHMHRVRGLLNRMYDALCPAPKLEAPKPQPPVAAQPQPARK